MQPCFDFRNRFSCDICVDFQPVPRPQETFVLRTIRIQGTVPRVMYPPSRNLALWLHPIFLRLGLDIVEFACSEQHERQVELTFPPQFEPRLARVSSRLQTH